VRRIDFVEGGVTAPAGFAAAGIAAGIKKNGRRDLALVVADGPASAAGVFTISKAAAAPVLVSKAHLAGSGGVARAVVINSGCANACTGAEGLETARLMATEAARALGCDPEEVLVASTGVIGVALDPLVVTRGIIAAAAVLDPTHGAEAADAIMTTDPFPKSRAVRVSLDEGAFTVGGMAKGSGMIEPMMATMLAVLTTDAAVPATLLRRALVDACDETFNAITVDGECSTNDSVFVLASGRSEVVIDESNYDVLVDGLAEVSRALALDIVRGGEGATKLVTVRVTGAASREDARRAARAIANSPLVKTAVHGGDPNWGRLVAVAGRSGSEFDLARARVNVGDVALFVDGRPFDERAGEAAAHLATPEVRLHVDLGTGGRHDATIWTCDLSAEYVKINAEYRT
jgi:glutamate N-acetyltransferase/amino-acid N-acetyltransferase